jgi:hypothetical protein
MYILRYAGIVLDHDPRYVALFWINRSNFEAILYDLKEQSIKNSFIPVGDFLNRTTTK